MIKILIVNSYDIDDICAYYLSVTTVLSEHEKKNHPEIRDDFLGDFLANGQIKFHPEFGDEIWTTDIVVSMIILSTPTVLLPIHSYTSPLATIVVRKSRPRGKGSSFPPWAWNLR